MLRSLHSLSKYATKVGTVIDAAFWSRKLRRLDVFRIRLSKVLVPMAAVSVLSVCMSGPSFAGFILSWVSRLLRVCGYTPGAPEAGQAGDAPLSTELIDTPLRHTPLVGRFPNGDVVFHRSNLPEIIILHIRLYTNISSFSREADAIVRNPYQNPKKGKTCTNPIC